MRKFHVVLTDGTERDVNAAWYDIEDGALNFYNSTEPGRVDTVLTYADGTWRYVEIERLDDKG